MSTERTNLNLTPSIELFNKSYDLVKKNFRIFALLYALPVLYTITQIFAHGSSKLDVNVSSDIHIPTGLLIALPIMFVLFIFVAVIYQTMLTVLELKVTKKSGEIGFKQLWKEAQPYWGNLFVLGLLMGLYIIVGFILLIVPGIIMIRRYYLAPYFMIDKNLSPREAMRQSAAASKKVSGYIWGVIVITVLIGGLLSLVPFFGALLSALFGAAYSVAPALRYQEIKNLATASDK